MKPFIDNDLAIKNSAKTVLNSPKNTLFLPKIPLKTNKKAPKMGLFHYAEREGFEPYFYQKNIIDYQRFTDFDFTMSCPTFENVLPHFLLKKQYCITFEKWM